MLSLFTLWALIGIITALMIPSPNSKSTTTTNPLLKSLRSRQSLNTYTSHSLNTSTILPPQPCLFLTSLGTSTFPTTQTLNATQCHTICTRLTSQFTTSNPDTRCRFFNAYLLFKNGENQGLTCTFFTRWYGNEWARNNGSYDAWGKLRNTQFHGDEGDEWEVRDSVVFWRKGEEGDLSCPAAKINGTETAGGPSVNVTGTGSGSGSASDQTSSTSFSVLVPPQNTSAVLGNGSLISATGVKATSTPVRGPVRFPQHKGSTTLKTSTTKSTTKTTTSTTTTTSKSSRWRRNGDPQWGSSGSMPAMH